MSDILIPSVEYIPVVDEKLRKTSYVTTENEIKMYLRSVHDSVNSLSFPMSGDCLTRLKGGGHLSGTVC